MMLEDTEALGKRFDAFDSEYICFSLIKKPLSKRPDLHAFLMLDKLFPAEKEREADIVCSAEHDEIWLDIEGEQVAQLTDDQIRDLVRCGVRYDQESDCLAMFA